MTDKNLCVACPRCGARVLWLGNPHRPFCSEKCRMVDLGCWAGEEYRLPVQSGTPEDFAENMDFPSESPEED